MKIKLNQYVRMSGIVLSIVMIVVLGFFLYMALNKPGMIEEEIPLYAYEQKGSVNYNVTLHPNILYTEGSRGAGETYISKFVDTIATDFSYQFKGERAADIKGEYEIIAVVEGIKNDGEKIETIWEKSFILAPKTAFSGEDNAAFVQQNMPIELEKYNAFARQVMQDSGINSEVRMTVFWNVDLKAKTDKGVAEEKISPKMVIPLNTKFFQIEEHLIQDQTGHIGEMRQIPLPVNRAKVITYIVIMVLGAMLSVFLLFFTVKGVSQDPLQKKLKKIFKAHGDRLVALNNEVAAAHETQIAVKSMEDLVRIADEIGHPIMYKHQSDLKHISSFYVLKDSNTYTFRA